MPRILPVNDEDTIPGTVVIVETATTSAAKPGAPGRFHHSFRICHAIAARLESGRWTREKSETFRTAENFWHWLNWVRQPGRPIWLFGRRMSHQLAWLGLWRLMESGDFSINRHPTADLSKVKTEALRRKLSKHEPGLLVDDNPPTVVICFHKSGWRLICLDIANYIDATVSQLAGLVDAIDLGETTQDDTDSTAEWCCTHTAKIVRECTRRLITWHKRQELGRFGFGIAGMALAAFRHRFMMDSIELPDDQDERDWQREAYFNGRCEALWVGRIESNRYYPARGNRTDHTLFDTHPSGTFIEVDARSFYGAVCWFQSLPHKTVESHLDGKCTSSPTLEQSIDCIGEVEIMTQTPDYPARLAGLTVYPTGHFRTVLAGPELADAHRKGKIVKWHAWQRYETLPIFHNYADKIYAERIGNENDGDKVISAVCKSLLARLHGKFMQRSTRWVLQPKLIAAEPWERTTVSSTNGGKSREFRAIAYDIQERVDMGDAPHCFPAIAAFVTSWGRTWLRRWVQVAGDKNVLYMNTDSMIVTLQGFNNLSHYGLVGGREIGSLKEVHRTNSLEIRGPNNITIDGKHVIGGLPANAVHVDGGHFRVSKFDSFAAILAQRGPSKTGESQEDFRCGDLTVTQRIAAGGWLVPPALTLEDQSVQNSHAADKHLWQSTGRYRRKRRVDRGNQSIPIDD